MNHQRLALLVLLGLAISACQTPVSDSVHFSRAEQIRHWDISGRLGYRTRSDGGSASVDWQQRPAHGRLHFSGPLGFGSAKLNWDDQKALLKTRKGEFQARTPGELAWRLTGFWLPVAALEYWARGLPWPNVPSTPEYNDQEQLVALTQLGWSLTFDRYQTVAGVALPHRIKAVQNSNRFTLLVKNWQPLAPDSRHQ